MKNIIDAAKRTDNDHSQNQSGEKDNDRVN